jgi:hypothetical protein
MSILVAAFMWFTLQTTCDALGVADTQLEMEKQAIADAEFFVKTGEAALICGWISLNHQDIEVLEASEARRFLIFNIEQGKSNARAAAVGLAAATARSDRQLQIQNAQEFARRSSCQDDVAKDFWEKSLSQPKAPQLPSLSPEDEEKALLSMSAHCINSEIALLDDKVSDATTVAKAVIDTCKGDYVRPKANSIAWTYIGSDLALRTVAGRVLSVRSKNRLGSSN